MPYRLEVLNMVHKNKKHIDYKLGSIISAINGVHLQQYHQAQSVYCSNEGQLQNKNLP